MATSQNGWPVDATGAGQDRSPIHAAVTVPNGVLRGDVAVVLRWVAALFHETVEPLKAGACWGWYVKNIEGSASVSNHASGTAIDLNADQHPMGVAASKTFTAKQVAACRAIETASGGVVRWGGSYSGRPDPMHWEINASAARVKAFADKIRSEEDDMGLTADDKQWITSQVVAAVANAVWNHEEPDPDPAKSGAKVRRVGGDMRMMEARRRDMEDRLDAKIAEVEAKVDELKGK